MHTLPIDKDFLLAEKSNLSSVQLFNFFYKIFPKTSLPIGKISYKLTLLPGLVYGCVVCQLEVKQRPKLGREGERLFILMLFVVCNQIV